MEKLNHPYLHILHHFYWWPNIYLIAWKVGGTILNTAWGAFQQYFLDDPAFRLVAILKSIKIFKIQLKRNPFLRQLVPNIYKKKNDWKTPAKKFAFCKAFLYLWTKSLKYSCEGILFFSLLYLWLYLWLFLMQNS